MRLKSTGKEPVLESPAEINAKTLQNVKKSHDVKSRLFRICFFVCSSRGVPMPKTSTIWRKKILCVENTRR